MHFLTNSIVKKGLIVLKIDIAFNSQEMEIFFSRKTRHLKAEMLLLGIKETFRRYPYFRDTGGVLNLIGQRNESAIDHQ